MFSQRDPTLSFMWLLETTLYIHNILSCIQDMEKSDTKHLLRAVVPSYSINQSINTNITYWCVFLLVFFTEKWQDNTCTVAPDKEEPYTAYGYQERNYIAIHTLDLNI